MNVTHNIIRVLEKYEGKVLFAYLFGSTAHDEGALSGDIDIAVYFAEGTQEAYLDAKLSLYADLCRALKRNDVDLVILNAAVNLILLDEIVKTGIILYDRDPSVRTGYELEILHSSLDFKGQRMANMGV